MGLPSPSCVPQGLLRQTCFFHDNVCTCPEHVTYAFRQQGSPGPQTLSAHETILLLSAVPVSPAAASISPPALTLPALSCQRPTLGEDQVATQPAVPIAIKAGGCPLRVSNTHAVSCAVPSSRATASRGLSTASLRPPHCRERPHPQPEAQLLCELRFHLWNNCMICLLPAMYYS